MKILDLHISTGRERVVGDETFKCSHSAKIRVDGLSKEEVQTTIERCRLWLEQKNDDHLKFITPTDKPEKKGKK